jgi:XTP/dITP diphosphohydrolase
MSSEPKPVLLAATFNAGKIREIQSCLSGLGYRILGLDSLPEVPPTSEDGRTFEANARQKAVYYSQFSNHLTLADDSGLEVDALGGLPGIHSARFVSKTATDEQRYREILVRLELVPEADRGARFVCCLALARQGEVLKTFEGKLEGVIGFQPRGGNGFGYDPIFLLPHFGKTMAELSDQEKNRLSHRGIALRKLIEYLQLSQGSGFQPKPTGGSRWPRR